MVDDDSTFCNLAGDCNFLDIPKLSSSCSLNYCAYNFYSFQVHVSDWLRTEEHVRINLIKRKYLGQPPTRCFEVSSGD